MKRFEIFFGLIKIPTDLFMTISGFLIAYKLRLITSPTENFVKPVDFTTLPTIDEYFYFGAVLSLGLFAIFALGKMYSLKITDGFLNECRKVLTLGAIWAMFVSSYFFFTRTLPFSRLAIFYSIVLTLLLIILGRGVLKFVQYLILKRGIGRRRVVFIGENRISEEIREQIKNQSSYKIVGTVKNLKELEEFAKHNYIDEVIQTSNETSKEENEEIIEFCDLKRVIYRFVPNLLEVRRTNVDVGTVGGIPIITLRHTPLEGWGKVVKRTIDLLGSAFGLALLSPIFAITAIAIKADSKGPIFFTKLDNGKRVKRVGQGGKLFNFYKFRSMHPNTDSMRYTTLAQHNTRQGGPLIKINNDPRITRVGRFIRKFSIDELPQLFSVLRGDMSLVGPRPHLPEEVAKYQKHHHFVLTIKPGITGLPQISGRSDLSFEEEVKLDRFYIENWSIWMDLKILLKTFAVLWRGYKE